MASAMGATVGAGFATVIMAYGPYVIGMIDLQTAHRNMMVGGGGMAAGTVFVLGTTALVTTFGTASTGIAIGSLSGAAATNAVLAWLGGGSLLTGGGGVALGATLLTGGAIVIGVGVSFLVAYYFYERDRKMALERYARDLAMREEIIRIRFETISKRVQEGKQPEWQVP